MDTHNLDMIDINNMVADQMACVVDMILQGKFSFEEYCFDDLVAFGEIVREECLEIRETKSPSEWPGHYRFRSR